MTEWRPVVGFEGVYEVSVGGLVRRLRQSRGTRAGKVLKLTPTKQGYYEVTLVDRGRRKKTQVHQLVAEAFIGLRPAMMEVNHMDGCKTNNRVSNLEYVTHSQNVGHAVTNRLNASGDRHGRRKLNTEAVREIRRRLKLGELQRVIASCFGVSQSCITDIKRGLKWAEVA